MEFEPENYQAATIVRDIIQIYNLNNVTSQTEDTLRKQLKVICRNIKVTVGDKEKNLWEKSAQVNGKQTRHYFTKEERYMILTSPQLREYITVHQLDEESARTYLRDKEKAEEKAQKANEAYEEMLINMDWDELQNSMDVYEGVSEEDFTKKKLEIMIEAIFLKFFEMDEQKLKYDMEMSIVPSGADVTAEMIMAYDRLSDGRNYYRERKEK